MANPGLPFIKLEPIQLVAVDTSKKPKQRTLVIGDIHGRSHALKQVLKLSKFNSKKDRLIVLGDICDGGEDTAGCVDILLGIQNLIVIQGNHDAWFCDYLRTGEIFPLWWNQGGQATLDSYFGFKTREMMPFVHKNFFLLSSKPFYKEKRMVFVHGGFHSRISLESMKKETLYWDRNMIEVAKTEPIRDEYRHKYKKVFIGHTTVQLIMNNENFTEPLFLNNVICLDTGAGWNGKLTIMDVETNEYWQSEKQDPAKRKKPSYHKIMDNY